MSVLMLFQEENINSWAGMRELNQGHLNNGKLDKNHETKLSVREY